ncbi:Sec-independent protein translocase subunit TatB [Anaplasma capra]|uniref:Sec-independent protein translocase subunit TatB n=1 Tax=Anaplasma capra TaxID=1562740 RepID=UPI0021D5C4D7|nr:hypothetical protein [Anaplasma capra]MCU7611471.1 hypothetical protein [Anaplasma capra]MCU7612090.1 hypothetical protein [Anaplasma capra]
MLNVGFSEMVLILVVGCLATDPKKIPGLLRTAGTYYRKFSEIKEEVLSAVRAMCNESKDGNKTHAGKKRYIMGNDGALHEAYEIRDMVGRSTSEIQESVDENYAPVPDERKHQSED